MMIKIIFLNILFLLLFSSCASKVDSSSNSTQHAIESKELRLIMREFNMVVYDDSKSVLELDDIRRRHALTLADTIEKLSYKIESIPLDKLLNNKPKEDIVFFTKHLSQLRKHAKEIHDIAQNYELEKLQGKIEELKNTCNSCHSKFGVRI